MKLATACGVSLGNSSQVSLPSLVSKMAVALAGRGAGLEASAGLVAGLSSQAIVERSRANVASSVRQPPREGARKFHEGTRRLAVIGPSAPGWWLASFSSGLV